MKAVFIALLLGAFPICSSWAQGSVTLAAATMKTHGDLNGRFWRALKASDKLSFLVGYSVGMKTGSVTAQGTASPPGHLPEIEARFQTVWPFTLTNVEIRAAMDRFYATPENGPIAIWGALMVVAQKARGAKNADIQNFVNSLRSAASQPEK